MDPLALKSNFAALDWVIVGVYLSLSLLIGVWANRYIHNTKAYLIGGGKAGSSLNAATYVGTTLGLVTLMYAAIDAFSHGFAFVTLALIGLGTGLLLGCTGLVIGPLRRMNLMTIPEYFEKRYSRRLRVAGGCICALAGILNMGLFPKMGATFLTYSTGMQNMAGDANDTVNLITSLLILMVLFYTVLGGMVSVIITDYIQFVVLSLGMGLGVYFCLTHPDLGWQTMLSTIAEHRGERMFNPLAADSGYGWTWILFNCLVFLYAGFCWAPEASRSLTARDESAARRTFLLASPGMFVRLAIPALWAVAAFTLVAQSEELTGYFFPDGLANDPAHAAEAMPATLAFVTPTGLLGLLVAGMLAAFMSTHDSYLLCWSSVITRDIVGPLVRRPLTDGQEILITRISVIVIGLFLLVWGVWYELTDSVWTYMAVSGTIYMSGAGVVLLGGLYWSRASTVGAWAAMLSGLLALLGLFLEPVNTQLAELEFDFAVSGPAFGLFVYAFCGAMFVVFSLLFPDKTPHPASAPIEEAR
ncbi:sodium:solute symporter family protein [Lignipirellula cremea]|uniref:Sodium/glucose cotransporter n=1 Tax=Lignipirellula cremea TaxID=2528010 RepID=A0A518DZA8_9BACT|nr:sodium:solute symporter family protein [Lignipirellula cremea]QDU97169.1 Sodium/glucose cotransporter [Lignipirellula cremea]